MTPGWWNRPPPVYLELGEPQTGVACIRINRPESRNALSIAVRRELACAFEEAARAETIRAIVLAGNERCFASGGDIKENSTLGPVDIIYRGFEKVALWGGIARCRKPVIAAVRGYALGGGAELMMLADIIVASETARIGQPEANVGIVPGSGGTQRLPRAVGKYVAMKMLLTGRPVSGLEASRAGLVSVAVADDEVDACAFAIAGRIAANAPLAAWFAKEAVLAADASSLDAGLALEERASLVLTGTEDFKVGVRAFLQKQTPRFNGH